MLKIKDPLDNQKFSVLFNDQTYSIQAVHNRGQKIDTLKILKEGTPKISNLDEYEVFIAGGERISKILTEEEEKEIIKGYRERNDLSKPAHLLYETPLLYEAYQNGKDTGHYAHRSFNYIDQDPKYSKSFQLLIKIIEGEIPFKSWPSHAAWAWIEWLAQTPHEDHLLISEYVIKQLNQEEQWNNSETSEFLAHKVSSFFRQLYDNTSHIKPSISPTITNACLAWDNELAKLLENLSHEGRKCAKHIRKKSEDNLKSFDPNTPQGIQAPYILWIQECDPLKGALVARFVARALWFDVVKPRLMLENRKRRNPPALTIGVAPVISRSCGWREGATVMPTPDGGLQVIDSRDINQNILSLAPALEVQNIKSLFGRSLSDDYPALASLRGQELIAWIVCEVWQRTMEGETAPRELIIEGGLKKLRELMGLKGNDGAESNTLAAALRAGSGFRLYAPGLEVGGLWTYYLREARRGQPSRLEIGVSSFLAPNYKPHGERLVPIIGTPPLIGSPRTYAPQVAFKFELVLEMVRAGETVLDGGALLPESERERLAYLVGLPTSTMNKALDRWTQDGEDGPRMLEREGDRFLLADVDPYRDAREFILEGARRAREGRESGLRSAAARERARRTPRRRR